MEPQFLSFSEVIEIHQDQITRYGGHPGIRDINLLKSSTGMPSVTYGGEFLHANLFEMASAYKYHIIRNHPFVDGNKRTGFVCSLVFLIFNGIELKAPEKTILKTVFATASGELTKTEITDFFRKWSKKKK